MTIEPHFIKKVSYTLTEKSPINARINNHQAPSNRAVYDMHYPLEIGIVLSGKVIRHYDDKAITLKENDLWFCGIWQPHGYELPPNETCSVLVLMFLPEMLNQNYFPESGITDWLGLFMGYSGAAVSFQDTDNHFSTLKQRLINLCSAKATAPTQLYLHLAVLELLMLLNEKQPQHHALKSSSFNTDELLPALHLVFNNPHLISLDTAAIECGMSTESFRKKFKSNFKINFSQFALRHRLQQVARDLLTTQDPIKAIAENNGFTDSSHLHRLFTRFYNQTPKEFRYNQIHGQYNSQEPA